MNDVARGACTFEDCGRTTVGRGLCRGHYDQWYEGHGPLHHLRPMRPSNVTPKDWFLSWFDTSGGPDACHEWQRGRNSDGYGDAEGPLSREFGTRRTHMLMWILANGPIPDGLWVLHSCDNPPCGNLQHLRLGTHKDNMADCVSRGRAARGEKNRRSHLTEEGVRQIRQQRSAGESANVLAATYGVHPETIYAVCARKLWKHVD